MSAQATVKRNWAQVVQPVRNLVFGRQNERIEFVMDSYFKLPPEGRTAVLVGGFVLGVLTLIGLVAVYVGSLGSLQGRLDQAFEATNKLREQHSSYQLTRQKFTDLETRLASANQNLVLISVLEQKAKDLGLSTNGFQAQPSVTDLPPNNPLSDKYQSAKVDIRITNASLKKIIDFVIAVESTPHMLRVSSLKIKGLYQNKLFFDANFEVEGTVAKR